MGVLSDIINTSNDIIKKYNSSKKPKFIKHKLADKERKLLMQEIDKLTKDNTTIPVKIISEYSSLMSEQFPPFGQHNHCRRSIYNASSAVIIFEFNLVDENDSVVVSIQTTNEEQSAAVVNYSYIKNHNPFMSFTDTDITILHSETVDVHRLDLLGQATAIRNCSAKCIIEDISEYLRQIIYKEEL